MSTVGCARAGTGAGTGAAAGAGTGAAAGAGTGAAAGAGTGAAIYVHQGVLLDLPHSPRRRCRRSACRLGPSLPRFSA